MIIGERETGETARSIYAIGEETALRIRELFRGYGARSTRDPVVEAEQLGLVTPPAAGAGWTA